MVAFSHTICNCFILFSPVNMNLSVLNGSCEMFRTAEGLG